MARHRSPSGQHRSPGGTPPPQLLQHPSPAVPRRAGAHRIPRPTPAARGRFVVAAVAVGAVAAAGQGLAQTERPQRTDGTTPLAFDGNQAVTFDGVGGAEPAPGVLPLPEVVTIAPDTRAQDVSSLANGQRIAQQRSDDAREAAEQAAALLEQQAVAGVSQLTVPDGGAVMPTRGRFTSGYGARWGTTHYGLDIANAIGTPVYAPVGGVVIESGPASGFGLWVRILHDDGTVTIYGHINESLVSKGQEVTAGEQIATIGNRGQSTGPHLHFEAWRDGVTKSDPAQWLREQGVDI